MSQEASRGESSGGGTVPPGSTNGTESMIGRRVTGFVEATFDAGYVLSLRIGESDSSLRGLVFKPGCIVPITEANDIAPHLPMIQRSEAASAASVPLKRKYTSRKQVRRSISPNDVVPFTAPGSAAGMQTDVPTAAFGADRSALDDDPSKAIMAVDLHGFESVNKMLDDVQETGNTQEALFDSLEQQHANASNPPPLNFETGRMTELLQAVEENQLKK